MRKDRAATEIIGAILLIGIIVGAFGIFAVVVIPTLKPETIPQVRLSMACNQTIGDDLGIEYPCTLGSFDCHLYDNKTCEENCKWKDYSQNSQRTPDQLQTEMMRCMEDCMSPLCSNLTHCEVLYICHLGGDTLQVSDMNVFVNGEQAGKGSWKIKKQTGDLIFTPVDPTEDIFGNGDSLKIPTGTTGQVDTVTIVYTPPSGGDVVLAMNQFGTDIT